MSQQLSDTSYSTMQEELRQFRERIETLTSQVVELSAEVAELRANQASGSIESEDLIDWYRSDEFTKRLSQGMSVAASDAIVRASQSSIVIDE